MTTPTKRAIKRFIIRYEMAWYFLTGLGYVASVTLLVISAPKVSGLTIAVIQLITGFTATVAAAASSIKSSDTDT